MINWGSLMISPRHVFMNLVCGVCTPSLGDGTTSVGRIFDWPPNISWVSHQVYIYASMRSCTILWKMHRCIGGRKRCLFFISLLTTNTLNFLVSNHEDSLFIVFHWFICLAPCCCVCCVLLQGTFVKQRWEMSFFPCLLLAIVMFTHLLICWLFIHSIGFHQTTKLCFYISSFLFILKGVLCKWGKTLKRLPRQLCYLLFQLKTLNYHILLIVANFRV